MGGRGGRAGCSMRNGAVRCTPWTAFPRLCHPSPSKPMPTRTTVMDSSTAVMGSARRSRKRGWAWGGEGGCGGQTVGSQAGLVVASV